MSIPLSSWVSFAMVLGCSVVNGFVMYRNAQLTKSLNVLSDRCFELFTFLMAVYAEEFPDAVRRVREQQSQGREPTSRTSET